MLPTCNSILYIVPTPVSILVLYLHVHVIHVDMSVIIKNYVLSKKKKKNFWTPNQRGGVASPCPERAACREFKEAETRGS